MKLKQLLFILVLFVSQSIFAKNPPKEGMWIPLLLNELQSDMQASGLKISAEDIYSINKSSLKDAVGQFGGGCTSEIISKDGLVLTNHHCGYGSIQSHSSVENDYLTNGFWAKNKSEELSNPGLTITFIEKIVDVTDQVLVKLEANMSEASKNAVIQQNIAAIKAKAIEGTKLGAIIRPFFYGNKYYMFLTKTFQDIRLVAAPPSSIGKFGGDTDNWMWPRHTGDFSIFRIYADENNNPAPYSPNNKPYKPKYHLPISLKGVKKDDFTMVMGFPGRTQEYLTSHAINYIYNVANPARIKIREIRLHLMTQEMKKSDKVRIQYSAKYARVSNYHKKWIGENRGLKKLNAIVKKQQLEKQFLNWINESSEKKSKYGHILPKFNKLYAQQEELSLFREYLIEAGLGIEAINYALAFNKLYTLSKAEEPDEAKIKAEVERLQKSIEGNYKNYNETIDKNVCNALLGMFYKDFKDKNKPSIFVDLIEKKYKGNTEKLTEELFKRSYFTNKARTESFLSRYKASSYKLLDKDLAFQLAHGLLTYYQEKIAPDYYNIEDQIQTLSKTYIKGLMEMQSDKKFYPDANSTLRVTYGKIEGYEPRDGVEYLPFSTIEGIIEKYKSGNDDYVVEQKIVDLYKNKDYGQYADKNGILPVCFIASNHTTGGNSGSPVFNGNGELIGLNFDRNWEGTMSDLMYDPDRVRNIAVDIRYVLFVIEKIGNSKHLIDELTLIK